MRGTMPPSVLGGWRGHHRACYGLCGSGMSPFHGDWGAGGMALGCTCWQPVGFTARRSGGRKRLHHVTSDQGLLHCTDYRERSYCRYNPQPNTRSETSLGSTQDIYIDHLICRTSHVRGRIVRSLAPTHSKAFSLHDMPCHVCITLHPARGSSSLALLCASHDCAVLSHGVGQRGPVGIAPVRGLGSPRRLERSAELSRI